MVHMELQAIRPIGMMKPVETAGKTELGATDLSRKFGALLNDAIQKLNEQQLTVEQLTGQFVAGELSDVHQLMIASERASLGLELTVQLRNKVIEAYQEIMRMQI